MPGMSPLVITHRRRGPRFARTLSLACVCVVPCVYSAHLAARHSPQPGHGTRSPRRDTRHTDAGISRAAESGTQRPGYRPTRALQATVPISSGSARKHTAEFEPAAWSWAQMTSGFGAI